MGRQRWRPLHLSRAAFQMKQKCQIKGSISLFKSCKSCFVLFTSPETQLLTNSLSSTTGSGSKLALARFKIKLGIQKKPNTTEASITSLYENANMYALDYDCPQIVKTKSTIFFTSTESKRWFLIGYRVFKCILPSW